jgi:hypothetical protein
MDKQKKQLKAFILQKVKNSTSPDRPYFIVKWSGLNELAKALGYDLLEVIDEMCKENVLKKALIPSKDRKTKLLALYLPSIPISKKAKDIMQEFQKFINKES